MNEERGKVTRGLRVIEDLNKLHARFVDGLETSALSTNQIGTLTVTSSKISCYCLNKTITATHRPIYFEGDIKALEFDFVTEWKSEELSILRLYLQTDEIVTSDIEGEDKLCNFDNKFISEEILLSVSIALLNSDVFASRQSSKTS